MYVAIRWVYLVVLGVWIGSIVFFSFVAAPAIHRTLNPEQAGALLRRLFPAYYLVGLLGAAAGIACVAILLAANALRVPAAIARLLLLAGMGAVDLWMRQAVAPAMNRLRQEIATARTAGQQTDPEADADWKSLHRLSVQANVAVLLGGLVLLFLLVYARVV
ncbi:DUF4149 domain-containing protein [bacterium]|nr:DUF4149 domain-containing protein [bacterium]